LRTENLDFGSDGAQLFARVLDATMLLQLETLLPATAAAGVRIYNDPSLADWLSAGPMGVIAGRLQGAGALPVRAILFDKSPTQNWTLGWHQDRTIAVRHRKDVFGFSHWTSKAGAIHVEPPFSIVERMVTARIHLDPVPEDNGPLLIAPGSHFHGRIDESAIEGLVAECGTFACLADAGDIWLYRTAILHASERARVAGKRRVLQVDFAAEELPGGLEWLGVA